MPLLQLKRTKRYNVSKKSDCIQTVQLLDETQIECTLTIESTGQDCLENVLQRINVAQPAYFGLRFEAKAGSQPWQWVDLGKPLKRQLQKRAATGAHLVHLGILHYAEHPHAIADEVTRYQFYLQLRSDVSESKVTCTYEQAVMMASYCLQAGFGDYDYARHNADYVREIENIDRTLLPRVLAARAHEQGILADIARHIVDGHMSLSGLTADAAEQQYVKLAEQLDGYGLEYFKVKTDQGAEAFIGCSPGGIVVRRPDGHVLHYFRWSDIASVSHNKKQLSIDMSSKKKLTTKFIADDAILCKYMWKMALLHRQFYLNEAKAAAASSKRSDGKQHDGAVGPMPDIQQSTMQLDGRAVHENAVDVDFHLRNPYRPTADAAVADFRAASGHQAEDDPYSFAAAAPMPQAAAALPVSFAYSQSTAVAGNSLGASVSSGRTSLALPTYRSTPDYETVMRQKLQIMQQQQQMLQQMLPTVLQPPSSLGTGLQHGLVSSGHSAMSPVAKYVNGRFTKRSSMSASQPDVYGTFAHDSGGVSNGEPLYANIDDYAEASRQRRAINRSSSLVVHSTYSQPDVSAEGGIEYSAAAAMAMQHPDDISQMLLRDYRPPPAYGDKFRSTPDLTSHIVAGAMSRVTISGGVGARGAAAAAMPLSPDVVSRRYRAAEVRPVVVVAAPPPVAIRKAGGGYVPPVSQKQYKSFDNLASIGDEEDAGAAAARDDGERNSRRRRASQTSNDTFHEVASDEDEDEDDGSSSVMRDQYSTVLEQHTYSNGNAVGNGGWPLAGLKEGLLDAQSRDLASHVRLVQHNLNADKGAAVAAMAEQGGNAHRTVFQESIAAAVPRVLLPPMEERFPKDERRRLLEEKLTERGVIEEYDGVPKKRAKSDCRVALQPECAPLNRFPNVLPYEDTRVRLSPSERNKLGYINASLIKVKVAGTAFGGAGEECLYIATQNPQDNTRDDFWQMVWEHEVHIVTMASGLEEQGQMKCSRYWPDEVGAKAAVVFGELLIALKCSNASPCFVTRCFKVKHIRTGHRRDVWHIQYTDWPQSGCPANVHGFLAYLDEVNSVRLHVQMAQAGAKCPLVVHCSAGVARTGVVILCDIMKKCLEHNQQIGVSDVLSQLRQQRMYMVQNGAQYAFCYLVLIEYLKGSRLI